MNNKKIDRNLNLSDKLTAFHKSLEEVEKVLQPVMNAPVSELTEKMEPLDKARIDLVSAYALNSLFWMLLITKGEDVQNHDVKGELGRIQQYMQRVQVCADRVNAPRLDVPAAKRFVQSALWTPKAEISEDHKPTSSS